MEKLLPQKWQKQKKTDKHIFDLALSKTNATSSQSIYIGDDLLVDVVGAKDAGWHCIYFNPHQVAHPHSIFADVQLLEEIKRVL